MRTSNPLIFAVLKIRSMCSMVLFSLTLSPTSCQVTPFSLRKSFCGSVTTTAVSFLSMSIVFSLPEFGTVKSRFLFGRTPQHIDAPVVGGRHWTLVSGCHHQYAAPFVPTALLASSIRPSSPDWEQTARRRSDACSPRFGRDNLLQRSDRNPAGAFQRSEGLSGTPH